MRLSAKQILLPALLATAAPLRAADDNSQISAGMLVDQLEATLTRGRVGYAFDTEAWLGTDTSRFWLKAKGSAEFSGPLDELELKALWGHAVGDWFDLQLGIRQDLGPRPHRTHVAFVIEGIAPYWFDLEVEAFLSNHGEVTARLKAEQDIFLARHLILQPGVEFNFSAQTMPELETGAGMTSAEVAFRLRYEIAPYFAPYLGIQYERAIGPTARYRTRSRREQRRIDLASGCSGLVLNGSPSLPTATFTKHLVC